MLPYVTLKLGQTKSGKAKTLKALRSTADYYGWTDEFEEWIGETFVGPGGRILLRDVSRRGHPECSGGRRMRISRSPSRSGQAAGLVNAFKVSSNTGLFDLAELAHFTKVEWHWMTDVGYQRVSRADWERRYARTTH